MDTTDNLIQFPIDNPYSREEALTHKVGKALIDNIQQNNNLTQEAFFLMLPDVTEAIAIRETYK